MTQSYNDLGQAIGFAMPHWQSLSRPGSEPIQGNWCRVEPLNANQHAQALYDAFANDDDHHNWTYMPYGPFRNFTEFQCWLDEVAAGDDPLFYTIIDLKSEKPVGMASYLRINPKDGVIEVGHIHFSPLLQRTTLATESMYLMMKRVFDELGYRRYEWKCDALNQPSCQAASRLGFTFEGIFRQLTMYKGRNRDTAWYAIIDQDWPVIRRALQDWLEPGNFNQAGKQKQSLSHFMPKI